MDDNKLLSCPFCKSEPELIRRGNDFTNRQTAIIKCTKPGCTCEMRVGVIRQSYQWAVDRVIEKWNTRAALVPAAGVVPEVNPNNESALYDAATLANKECGVWVQSIWLDAFIRHWKSAAAPEPEKAQGDELISYKWEIELLRKAVEAGDPKGEILMRIDDILNCRSAGIK